jgi:hypothetical protein
MSAIEARRSLPPVPPRLELDALLAQRKELDERHELAALVALVLEKEGPDRALLNRRKCAAICDERAAVQKRIDDFLAAERAR